MFTVGIFPGTPLPESLCGEPQEWTLLGRTLRDYQERAILLAGGQLVEGKAEFWIREDVMVSAEALKLFAENVKGIEKPVRWLSGGRTGLFVADLLFGDIQPMLVYVPGGTEVQLEVFAQADELRVDVKERLFTIPVDPEAFGADFIELPITDFIVLPVRHWLQLLWANLLGLGPFLWRELAGNNPFTFVWNLLWTVIRARSIRPRYVIAALQKTGKKCNIHPSAVVEGCWLGENVEVGANAVVRGCILADGVKIEELAMVEFSVLGTGARVQRQAMVKFSLLSPHSAAAGVMQLGVLDEQSSFKRGSFLMDMTFGDDGAKVLVDEKLHHAPLGIAGCCIGKNTSIGLGVQVAAGRYIPPDLRIISDPERMLRKIPQSLSGVAVVRDGGLQQHE